MKINDLFVTESVFNQQNNISDMIANLYFPQKYITLELDGELYSLDVVSVDNFEFIVRIMNKLEKEE